MSKIFPAIVKSFCKTVDAVEEGNQEKITAAYNQTLGLLEGLGLTIGNEERIADAKVLLENVRDGLYDGYETRIMVDQIFSECSYSGHETRMISSLSYALLKYWETFGDDSIIAIREFQILASTFSYIGFKVNMEKLFDLLSDEVPAEATVLEARKRIWSVMPFRKYETHKCVDRRDPRNRKTAYELADETVKLWRACVESHPCDTKPRFELNRKLGEIKGGTVFGSEVARIERTDIDELEWLVEAVRIFEDWGYRKF